MHFFSAFFSSKGWHRVNPVRLCILLNSGSIRLNKKIIFTTQLFMDFKCVRERYLIWICINTYNKLNDLVPSEWSMLTLYPNSTESVKALFWRGISNESPVLQRWNLSKRYFTNHFRNFETHFCLRHIIRTRRIFLLLSFSIWCVFHFSTIKKPFFPLVFSEKSIQVEEQLQTGSVESSLPSLMNKRNCSWLKGRFRAICLSVFLTVFKIEIKFWNLFYCCFEYFRKGNEAGHKERKRSNNVQLGLI